MALIMHSDGGGGGGSITSHISALYYNIQALEKIRDERLTSSVFQDDAYSVGRIVNQLNKCINILKEKYELAVAADDTRKRNYIQ